jgi:hypothetical protein
MELWCHGSFREWQVVMDKRKDTKHRALTLVATAKSHAMIAFA